MTAKSEKDMGLRFKKLWDCVLCDELTSLSDAMLSSNQKKNSEESKNFSFPPPEVIRKFLNKKKKHLLDLHKGLEVYLSTFPVFDFNSSR